MLEAVASQVALVGKEPDSQCRRLERLGFNPWVGKIPWMRARQPTPVFLPEQSHGQMSLAGGSSWCHTVGQHAGTQVLEAHSISFPSTENIFYFHH